jgi:hypothetical protein
MHAFPLYAAVTAAIVSEGLGSPLTTMSNSTMVYDFSEVRQSASGSQAYADLLS